MVEIKARTKLTVTLSFFLLFWELFCAPVYFKAQDLCELAALFILLCISVAYILLHFIPSSLPDILIVMSH